MDQQVVAMEFEEGSTARIGSLQLLAVDAEDALTVLKTIGSEGVWVEVNGAVFPSEGEAVRFSEAIHDISGSSHA